METEHNKSQPTTTNQQQTLPNKLLTTVSITNADSLCCTAQVQYCDWKVLSGRAAPIWHHWYSPCWILLLILQHLYKRATKEGKYRGLEGYTFVFSWICVPLLAAIQLLPQNGELIDNRTELNWTNATQAPWTNATQARHTELAAHNWACAFSEWGEKR